MQQKIVALVLLCGLLFSACAPSEATSTVDPNAIGTAIVGTTIAQLADQFTQTALAMPSTDIFTPELSPTVEDINTLVPLSTDTPPTLEGITTPLAGFTQLPAISTPVPTSSLGDDCNNNAFEGDITIPDGTIMKPGEDFQKIWKIRNTGSCTWDDGFTLVYIGGTIISIEFSIVMCHMLFRTLNDVKILKPFHHKMLFGNILMRPFMDHIGLSTDQ